MSNVINKSNHPVEIKKISLSLWSLRSEIETAIAEKLEASGDDDIEDIKQYYTSILNRDPNSEEADEDQGDERQDENLDSSGNPMDDDAAEMLAALNGGDDEDSDDEASDDNPEAEDATEEDSAEEDDEASALAAEMLGDQGSSDNEDDEAAALAAEMLADQGGDDSSSDAVPKKEFSRPTPEVQTEAFLMLSDITMSSCLLFTKGPFIQGQNIIIRFNTLRYSP